MGCNSVVGFLCNPDLHAKSLERALLSKISIFLCGVNACARSVPSMVFLLLCFAFWELEEGMAGKKGAEEARMCCSSKLQLYNWQCETFMAGYADVPQQTCCEMRGL